MKAKLTALLAAILLLAGCQANTNMNDKTPVEIDIENSQVGEDHKSNEDTQTQTPVDSNDEVLENQEQIDENNSDDEKSESPKDQDLNHQNQEVSVPTDTVVEPPENVGLEEIEVKRLNKIPNDQIKEGVLEACHVLSELHGLLNADELKTMDFKGIYETYYIQDKYSNKAQILDQLKVYFSRETAKDIIENWGLIENGGRLMAPEVSASVGYDLSGMDIVVSDINDESPVRFVNLSFTLNGEKKNSLLKLSRVKNEETWKLSTIPGKGLLTSHDGQFIRDTFWIEDHTQWSWPDFIASEDKAWQPVMEPLKEKIEASIRSKNDNFVTDEKFKNIGANQLSHWISWTYGEPNAEYPYVHVVESEYIKYGIHPNHIRHTVSLSKKTGEALSLDQIYTSKEEFEEVVNVFIDKYMRENKDAFYNDVLFEGINDSTQYYLTQTGIVFYFQLYEYAPYAYGYPEIEVPFAALKEVVNESFHKFVIEPSNDIINE